MKARLAQKILKAKLDYQEFARLDFPYTGAQLMAAAKRARIPKLLRDKFYCGWRKVSKEEGAWQNEEIFKSLTKSNPMKPILDACCGGKMFYFDKNDPRVLFQDIRKEETTLCDGRKFEVAPDVVGDFTSMRFPDNTFNMVVFDPPHLRWWGKDKEKQPTGFQGIKYGTLRSDWRETLAKGFAECFRVLRPGGFLIFKWNETDIKVSEVLKLTDQKPIFGHKSGKRANTHWICFMKGI